MGQIAGLTTFTTNTVISSTDMNSNFTIIGATYNAHDIAATGVHNVGSNTILHSASPQLVPIGSIIPFYDFNGGLTFNSTYWAYCNGQSKTISGSSRTLPDLSNRYLVGFGTEGGADNDSAAWATDAVGNASHQVDLSHTHTEGTLATLLYRENPGAVLYLKVGANKTWAIEQSITGTTYGGGTTSSSRPTTAIEGTTASGGSATQSIQPQSIRVRYLMRIL